MDTRIRESQGLELSFLGDLPLSRRYRQEVIATIDYQGRAPEGMTRPVSLEKAYALFGLLLGLLPTLSITVFLVTSHVAAPLWLFASVATGLSGYLLGGRAARWENRIVRHRLSWYLTFLPFIGIAWGAASGALGGVFLFLVGSIFGAVIGGVIGLLAVTPFAVVVRVMSRNGHIEWKHLLPIAFGIPSVVAALWLGS